RPAAKLQRRAADRGPVQGRRSGHPQPPGRGRRAVEAPDRFRERADLRAERRDAARRRQGVPADAPQRRGLGRGARAPARARRLLQPGLGEPGPAANAGPMGAPATVTLLADVISSVQSFVWVFATVYTLVLFVYILTSWVR